MLCVLLGMLLAARVYYANHEFHSGQIVLSDFENHEENPAGFAYAVAGMSLGCVLLIPAAVAFFQSSSGYWTRTGAVLFACGAIAGVVMALLDFSLDLYNPVHIFFAMSMLTGLAGGLSLLSTHAAVTRKWPGRHWWTALSLLQILAVLFVLEWLPLPARGSGGFLTSLGFRELAVMILLALSTAALAEAESR